MPADFSAQDARDYPASLGAVMGLAHPERHDLPACRKMIKHGSRSFYTASLLLPNSVAKPAYALYAFCRLSDDAVDLADGSLDAVQRLRERLELIYEGRPRPIPADRALTRVVETYELPKALPAALIEGFQWDGEGRDYDDLSGVFAYSARVAASVGAMMTLLIGARSAEHLARATDLGTAMQLTNICRDVGEDARNGRIYLPLDWMREEGIEPKAFLKNPVYSEGVARVVERVLDVASVLYERSETGIAHLPWNCRPAIFAARHIYAAIGSEVRRNRFNSVDQRAVTSKPQKIRLLGHAYLSCLKSRPEGADKPLPENQFLVDAVTEQDQAHWLKQGDSPYPWWLVTKRAGRMIDIIGRQYERDFGEPYGT